MDPYCKWAIQADTGSQLALDMVDYNCMQPPGQSWVVELPTQADQKVGKVHRALGQVHSLLWASNCRVFGSPFGGFLIVLRLF